MGYSRIKNFNLILKIINYDFKSFFSRDIGTTTLLLLGTGVVANVNLKNTIAENQTPWVLITAAWGFAVFVSVFITSQSSVHT